MPRQGRTFLFPTRTTHDDSHMHNLHLSKPESARAFLRVLRALNAPTDRRPKTSEEATKSALAEVVAHHADWAGEFSLGELFSLVDALIIHRDEEAGAAPAIYPIPELTEVCGSRTMSVMAVKLCGAFCDAGVWVDGGIGEPVTLTFDDWNPND